MRPRRRTVAVVVIGVLVLVAGLAVFLVGSTQADDSMADLARATDARSVDRQAAVAGRELDRQVEDALVDARLSTLLCVGPWRTPERIAGAWGRCWPTSIEPPRR